MLIQLNFDYQWNSDWPADRFVDSPARRVLHFRQYEHQFTQAPHIYKGTEKILKNCKKTSKTTTFLAYFLSLHTTYYTIPTSIFGKSGVSGTGINLYPYLTGKSVNPCSGLVSPLSNSRAESCASASGNSGNQTLKICLAVPKKVALVLWKIKMPIFYIGWARMHNRKTREFYRLLESKLASIFYSYA